jgi:hypothetical protein
MRRSRPDGDRWYEPMLNRLERVTGEINPFLIAIIIGLSLLNFSVFTALQIARLPLR